MILVVSIKIKNGFNQSGAPSGRKWAMDCFSAFVNDDATNDNHRGRPKTRVKIRWDDNLKLYGINPDKLIIITSKNNDEISDVDPFRDDVYVRISCSFTIIKHRIHGMKCRGVIDQNESWIIRINSMFDIRRIDVNECVDIYECGSNDEKMSNIITKYGGPFIALKAISLHNLIF